MKSIENALQKIANKSNGQMKILPVTDDKKPTVESLKKLHTEIHTQVEANRVREYRSFANASKMYK